MARQLLPAAMPLPPTLLASTNSGTRASQIWSTSVGCWVSLSIVSFPLVVAPCAAYEAVEHTKKSHDAQLGEPAIGSLCLMLQWVYTFERDKKYKSY
jgi:hypothetical protein